MQSDFKTYTMKNVTLDELRAIRALLPVFRQDQTIQREWAEGLDDKIDSLAAQGNKVRLTTRINEASGRLKRARCVAAGTKEGSEEAPAGEAKSGRWRRHIC